MPRATWHLVSGMAPSCPAPAAAGSPDDAARGSGGDASSRGSCERGHGGVGSAVAGGATTGACGSAQGGGPGGTQSTGRRAVFNQFMWSLGVLEDDVEFHDVYGLDTDALDMVPQPVLVAVLYFPDPPLVHLTFLFFPNQGSMYIAKLDRLQELDSGRN